jgi:AcrR family transcriptional regulator
MAYPSKTDRKTILAAAVTQLEQEGLRALSLRALAASLELAPTALYRYFADRSALEQALADEVSRLLHAAMLRALRKTTPDQAIRSIARAYLAFARKHPNLYELILLPCERVEGVSEIQHALWIFVCEHVTALTGDGNADVPSVAFWAFLHGIAELEAADLFTPKELADTFDFGLNAWIAAASSANTPKG